VDITALSLAIINLLSFGILFGLRRKATIKMVVWGCIAISVFCLEVFAYLFYNKYLSVSFLS
jgi:hypothetical protein